jgi:hypothetical protein
MWLLALQLNHAQLLRDRALYAPARAQLEAVILGLEALAKRPEIDDDRFYQNTVRRNLSRAYTSLASVLGQLGEHEAAELMLRKAEK